MRIVRRDILAWNLVIVITIAIGVGVAAEVAASAGLWMGGAAFVIGLYFITRKSIRRWRIARQELRPTVKRWLSSHVPMYRTLTDEDRARFDRDVTFVLSEWKFEGVGGIEVDDELTAAVAAGAAMLIHGRPSWELPSRHTVLFYPDRFDDDYLTGNRGSLDGMAHSQGPVIVSVEAVRADWGNSGSGHNVVLHELAHLLDFKESFADGVPDMLHDSSRPAWDDLVEREMRRIRTGHSMLRRYGATNRAEFFAVAVENFFERPETMRSRHPDLFKAFSNFFGYEPIGGEGTMPQSSADSVEIRE